MNRTVSSWFGRPGHAPPLAESQADGPLSEPAPQRHHLCVPVAGHPPCPRAPVRVADPCFFLASFRAFQRHLLDDNNTTTKLPAAFRQPPCNGTLPCRFCDSQALTSKWSASQDACFCSSINHPISVAPPPRAPRVKSRQSLFFVADDSDSSPLHDQPSSF